MSAHIQHREHESTVLRPDGISANYNYGSVDVCKEIVFERT